jgi:hypothetical protein
MVATEVLVAIISSGSVALITPIVACLIKKFSPDPVTGSVGPIGPTPDVCRPCMIQDTPIIRVLGIPVFNGNYCHQQRMLCKKCNKWFCTFHYPMNADGAPNGGHICVPVSNP